jgi:hypothetical protein
MKFIFVEEINEVFSHALVNYKSLKTKAKK